MFHLQRQLKTRPERRKDGKMKRQKGKDNTQDSEGFQADSNEPRKKRRPNYPLTCDIISALAFSTYNHLGVCTERFMWDSCLEPRPMCV